MNKSAKMTGTKSKKTYHYDLSRKNFHPIGVSASNSS